MADRFEGFQEGIRIAKLSVYTLVGIGIAEIIVGVLGGSVVAIADGIDSFGDATISFIVMIGLLVSQKHPDERFQFGYYKIESLGALAAAIGMVVMASFIVWHAWESFLHPEPITHTELILVTLAAAGGISMYRALQMRKIANQYKILSLQTDARNSIKDASASFIGFASVLVATYVGFLQMDSIGAMAVAAFIFYAAHIAIRESSLVLLDAIKNPKLPGLIEDFIEKSYHVDVSSVKVRPMGPFMHGEINVVLKGTATVREFDDIADIIELEVKKKFPGMKRVIVTVEPEEDMR